jgi:hypothetical protein
LIAILTSKEIERKRILVSKFKEDAINHIEIQELVNILEKEKHIAEEEQASYFSNIKLLVALISCFTYITKVY